jgi:response regulator RpfG family c-di-GMP phosphodiesterase
VRLLLVDDDAGLRALIRATFESFDIEVAEAAHAAGAREVIADERPDVIVLDVHMPGETGLELARALKDDPATAGIGIVLLTGAVESNDVASAPADAVVPKPFSPLELLAVAERLGGGLYGVPFRNTRRTPEDEQLMLYARDLRHVLELERGQRVLLEAAYRETVSALAAALETKDTGTRAHSQRVQAYALDLAAAAEPELADDASAEFGFLLHDVGKIGIPDRILLKPGPLTIAERQQMQTHTTLGEQMLGDVAFLRGEGLRIVRSHHERWDGGGYPDGIVGDEIPLGARIFAVADALDAMTSDRPYRRALPWAAAAREIEVQAAKQFDPDVVAIFRARRSELDAIRRAFGAGEPMVPPRAPSFN